MEYKKLHCLHSHFVYLNPNTVSGLTHSGVLIATWISSRWGRPWCMLIMIVYDLDATTIGVTSLHREQIMAARVLNYVYVGMELGVVPTFQSEIGMLNPYGSQLHNKESPGSGSRVNYKMVPI
ncbi:hypothetical protein FPOAC2_10417 [Fusarium poae]|jgi:hypothetical protein